MNKIDPSQVASVGKPFIKNGKVVALVEYKDGRTEQHHPSECLHLGGLLPPGFEQLAKEEEENLLLPEPEPEPEQSTRGSRLRP